MSRAKQGANKGPRVSKSLSYRRSWRLTYLEFNYGNLFKIPQLKVYCRIYKQNVQVTRYRRLVPMAPGK